jgi:flagellar motor component MotA
MSKSISWVLSIVTFAGIACLGAPLKVFIDLPSAIVSVVFPMLLVLSIYSTSEIAQALARLFSSSDGLSARQLRKSSQIFAAYGILSLASGILASMFGVIAILANLSNPATIGPNLSISLLTIFYSLLVYAFIAFPASNLLQSAATKASVTDMD